MISEPLGVAGNIFGVEVPPLSLSCLEFMDMAAPLLRKPPRLERDREGTFVIAPKSLQGFQKSLLLINDATFGDR